MRPKGFLSVISAAVLLMFVLAACQQTPTTTDGIDPTVDLGGDTTSDDVTGGDTTGGDTTGDDTETSAEVAVELMDNAINMPATVSAGTVTFEVTNSGTVEQNFMIEGAGVNSMLDAALAPGETATLEVDLEPGTYTVSSTPTDTTIEGTTLELVVA